MRSGNHADGLARGLVGQAEHGEISLVEAIFARGFILALLVRQRDEFDVWLFGESLVDLQTGGADMAIYENAFFHLFVRVFIEALRGILAPQR